MVSLGRFSGVQLGRVDGHELNGSLLTDHPGHVRTRQRPPQAVSGSGALNRPPPGQQPSCQPRRPAAQLCGSCSSCRYRELGTHLNAQRYGRPSSRRKGNGLVARSPMRCLLNCRKAPRQQTTNLGVGSSNLSGRASKSRTFRKRRANRTAIARDPKQRGWWARTLATGEAACTKAQPSSGMRRPAALVISRRISSWPVSSPNNMRFARLMMQFSHATLEQARDRFRPTDPRWRKNHPSRLRLRTCFSLLGRPVPTAWIKAPLDA
jgi:hypothetical protein